MDVTIAEELLLLGTREENGRPLVGSTELDCGVAGAALVELALAGRVDVVDKRLVVVNPSPVGDPELDGVLARVAGQRRPHKADWWVRRLRGFGLRRRLLRRLADRGVLREETRRFLGLFTVTRFPELDPSTELAVRQRLRQAVDGSATPDARTVALAGLVLAVGLGRKVFPDLDRRTLKRRLKELSEGEWAGAAVRKAIQAIHSETAAAASAAAGGGGGGAAAAGGGG